MFEFLFGSTPPSTIKFYDREDNEIIYLEYFPETGMLLIERNGQELIPVCGLTIKTI